MPGDDRIENAPQLRPNQIHETENVDCLGCDHSVILPAKWGANGWTDSWHSHQLGGTSDPLYPAGTSYQAIAAGAGHSLALKSDGTVVAWGYNRYRQATVPANLTGVAAVAAGDLHSLALKSDGTVVAWGNNNLGQTKVPANLTGVIAVAGGDYHSLALRSDGTVVAWGANTSGQSTVP